MEGRVTGRSSCGRKARRNGRVRILWGFVYSSVVGTTYVIQSHLVDGAHHAVDNWLSVERRIHSLLLQHPKDQTTSFTDTQAVSESSANTLNMFICVSIYIYIYIWKCIWCECVVWRIVYFGNVVELRGEMGHSDASDFVACCLVWCVVDAALPWSFGWWNTVGYSISKSAQVTN